MRTHRQSLDSHTSLLEQAKELSEDPILKTSQRLTGKKEFIDGVLENVETKNGITPKQVESLERETKYYQIYRDARESGEGTEKEVALMENTIYQTEQYNELFDYCRNMHSDPRMESFKSIKEKKRIIADILINTGRKGSISARQVYTLEGIKDSYDAYTALNNDQGLTYRVKNFVEYVLAITEPVSTGRSQGGHIANLKDSLRRIERVDRFWSDIELHRAENTLKVFEAVIRDDDRATHNKLGQELEQLKTEVAAYLNPDR